VALEVEAEHHLADEQELQDIGEDGVDVVADELAAAVRVAEEEAEDGEEGPEGLCRDVPPGLGDLLMVSGRPGRRRQLASRLTPSTMPIGKMTP